MNINKISKWISWGTVALLGFILILMQSLYLNAVLKIDDFLLKQSMIGAKDVLSEAKTKSIVGLVFAIIGIFGIIAAVVFAYKENELMTKISFFILIGVMIIFIISFAVPADIQNDDWKQFQNAARANTLMLPSWSVNAVRAFPVNISFLVICLVAFIPSGFIYSKEVWLF